MTTIVFDYAGFKAQFPDPQFPDPPYTEAIVQSYWNVAICIINPNTSCMWDETCLRTALNLLTAHLIALNSEVDASTGLVTQQGFVESATIDKITVSLQSYQTDSQFEWWLSQTPYGQQLLALISVRTAGGFYLGGSNELGAFRRAGGLFFPPS